MVMLNTWGDRGQDTKVNEAFCKEEIARAKKMGITHFQIDDGWQAGKSGNSAYGGSFLNIWSNPDYWKPSPEKYPNGLQTVVDAARNAESSFACGSIRAGQTTSPTGKRTSPPLLRSTTNSESARLKSTA